MSQQKKVYDSTAKCGFAVAIVGTAISLFVCAIVLIIFLISFNTLTLQNDIQKDNLNTSVLFVNFGIVFIVVLVIFWILNLISLIVNIIARKDVNLKKVAGILSILSFNLLGIVGGVLVLVGKVVEIKLPEFETYNLSSNNTPNQNA